ncbi:hypothetical protein AJ90_19770 [Vibrio parahaemolyticus M0605]|nr:hypothetical protein AJ90_19770 [Vibrio parahaemolyticus M0605]
MGINVDIIVNTDKNDLIVAFGNIKLISIVHTYSVAADNIPEQVLAEFSSYTYSNGQFSKIVQTATMVHAERQWQSEELQRVNAAIINYQIDMSLNESQVALKVSKLTGSEYLELLLYRKALIAYADTGYSPPRPSTTIVF